MYASAHAAIHGPLGDLCHRMYSWMDKAARNLGFLSSHQHNAAYSGGDGYYGSGYSGYGGGHSGSNNSAFTSFTGAPLPDICVTMPAMKNPASGGGADVSGGGSGGPGGNIWSGHEALTMFAACGWTPATYPAFADWYRSACEVAAKAKPGEAKPASRSLTTIESLLVVYQFLVQTKPADAPRSLASLQPGYHLPARTYAEDYHMALTMERGTGSSSGSSSYSGGSSGGGVGVTIRLNFWCMNPAVAFYDVSQMARSVLITSGTLAPLDSFATELGCLFAARDMLEAKHVINTDAQLWAAAVASSPLPSAVTLRLNQAAVVHAARQQLAASRAAGAEPSSSSSSALAPSPFPFSFDLPLPWSLSMRSAADVSSTATRTLLGSHKHVDDGYYDVIGVALLGLCAATPGGVLVFLPSYQALDRVIARWKLTTVGVEVVAPASPAAPNETTSSSTTSSSSTPVTTTTTKTLTMSLWQALWRMKRVFAEPGGGAATPEEFTTMLAEYRRTVDVTRQHAGHALTSDQLDLGGLLGTQAQGRPQQQVQDSDAMVVEPEAAAEAVASDGKLSSVGDTKRLLPDVLSSTFYAEEEGYDTDPDGGVGIASQVSDNAVPIAINDDSGNDDDKPAYAVVDSSSSSSSSSSVSASVTSGSSNNNSSNSSSSSAAAPAIAIQPRRLPAIAAGGASAASSSSSPPVAAPLGPPSCLSESAARDPFCTGAVLLAVCRGKASEGIDFADEYARAVAVVSIPYASAGEPTVVLKKAYQNDRHRAGLAVKEQVEKAGKAAAERAAAASRAAAVEEAKRARLAALGSSSAYGYGSQAPQLQQHQLVSAPSSSPSSASSSSSSPPSVLVPINGDDWYKQAAFRALNQALGRCIRHKDDYGAILLLDQRFAEPGSSKFLSKWVRPVVERRGRLPLQHAPGELEAFFRRCERVDRERKAAAAAASAGASCAGDATPSLSSSSAAAAAASGFYTSKRMAVPLPPIPVKASSAATATAATAAVPALKGNVTGVKTGPALPSSASAAVATPRAVSPPVAVANPGASMAVEAPSPPPQSPAGDVSVIAATPMRSSRGSSSMGRGAWT